MSRLHDIPVSAVRGVGKQREEQLRALGIGSVADLIEYFPYRYEDYRIREPGQASDGEKITVSARLDGMPRLQRYGRRKSRLSCRARSGSLPFTAVWFNQPFLKEKLQPGRELLLTGKWDARRRQITVSETGFSGASEEKAGTLQPVYSVGGAVTQKWLRAVIERALEQFADEIEEIIPEEWLRKRDLMPRKDAIARIHRPGQWQEGRLARHRIVYEEFFLFQLKIQAYRAVHRGKKDGISRNVDTREVRRFVRSLPFELTGSQKKVILDIFHDMQQPYCMNRLLQGDVGSGKTVVAAVALYANYLSGYQGALMVPTEILAEQHFRSLTRLFRPFGVEVALLTGRLTDKQRRDTAASLQMGLTDIVVGTHALIQENVFFRSLGLVITDEQHRFGVHQRSLLRKKGWYPDVLAMTATPIPRTLAITAFGDMDVSTLTELPKGRKPVKTYWVRPEQMDRVIGFIHKEVQAGRQAYVICPLIEESEKLDVQNAVDLHERLRQALPDIRVDLLHGKLGSDEKEEVMRRFEQGASGVLVSTTVVEVGVDNPNATLMVIYDADRFGLSQLHQLRGRVGRGRHQSYCVLVAAPRSETGSERMRVMTETQDGFEIARRDLELRGPGDYFGTKQSGLPEFKVADMMKDFDTLEMAREDASELVRRPDFWTAAAYLPLRLYLKRAGITEGEWLD